MYDSIIEIWMAGVPVLSFAGAAGPRQPNSTGEYDNLPQFEFCHARARSYNPLTKGRHFVSNFSAQCNERSRKQQAVFQSQRQNKPMFSREGVFRATDGMLDSLSRDTPRSKCEFHKNVGVRASRILVNKGGVAYGDQSRIVSLDVTFLNSGDVGTKPANPEFTRESLILPWRLK